MAEMVNKGKKCNVLWCGNQAEKKGLCGKHYRQEHFFGGIRRTYKDPNIFVIDNAICWIGLSGKDGKIQKWAIIDAECYELCKEVKWSINTAEYVFNVKNKLWLHHVVLKGQVGTGMVVDHINGNPLDNRKENLRVCTQSDNMCNSKIPRNNTSGFKGVHFDKRYKKWVSYISKNGKRTHLGYFDKKNDAYLAYKNAAKKKHGDFINLGEPKQLPQFLEHRPPLFPC